MRSAILIASVSAFSILGYNPKYEFFIYFGILREKALCYHFFADFEARLRDFSPKLSGRNCTKDGRNSIFLCCI